MVGHDAFGGAFVEPPKSVPTLAVAGIDEKLSSRINGLAGLICSPGNLSLKKVQSYPNI
jgi:hypothetical protein